MAVAHSAASESHTGTTGSTNQTSFSWTHTQTGTPQGVLVFVHTISTTDTVTSVTYGGTGLTRVSGGAAIDADGGEAGRTDLFFLGSGLASGNQTIVVNRTNNATIMYAAAATVTAATNTNVTGIVLLEGDGTMAVQSVTDGGAPTNSLRYAGAYSGLASPPPAGTGSTLLTSIDFGQYGCALVRETTAGTGARNVGFSSSTDDRAAVHVAVRELWNRTDTQTVGSFTLTGNAATLAKASPKQMDGGTGAFTLTGNAADLRHNAAIEGGTGTFALTGNPADARHNVLLEGGTGSYALTGQDAALAVASPKVLEAAAGSFALSGTAAGLAHGVVLAANSGEFTFTGQAATLTETAADELSALVGSFALTGQSATLTRTWQLTAEQGAVVLTAAASALQRTWVYAADVGQLIATGNAASLLASRQLLAAAGEFALVGHSVNLTDTDELFAAAGVFTLTGPAATLAKASTARRRNVLIF
jgi:hypothetical protein